jgi:nucleotide-binding universal stress UspA family protein
VIGADFSESSLHATRWLKVPRGVGPCEVVMVHLYWPPEQFHRLGLGGIRSYVDADPEVTRTLEREFSERFAEANQPGSVRYRLEPHLGRIADRLTHLGSEEKADLVLVGCHERNLMMRAWEGSVSRGVLQHAAISVACIPSPRQQMPKAAGKINNVLVATDFSDVGNEAVALAYSVVAFGGTVHLVHVLSQGPHDAGATQDIFSLTGKSAEEQAAATKQLAALIPTEAAAAGKQAQLHLLQARDAASAIAQAGERLNVELICVGTHGRSGLSKAVLGSVAQSVLSHTQRPVLFARTPRR